MYLKAGPRNCFFKLSHKSLRWGELSGKSFRGGKFVYLKSGPRNCFFKLSHKSFRWGELSGKSFRWGKFVYLKSGPRNCFSKLSHKSFRWGELSGKSFRGDCGEQKKPHYYWSVSPGGASKSQIQPARSTHSPPRKDPPLSPPQPKDLWLNLKKQFRGPDFRYINLLPRQEL